jgi:hypothetical protein
MPRRYVIPEIPRNRCLRSDPKFSGIDLNIISDSPVQDDATPGDREPLAHRSINLNLASSEVGILANRCASIEHDVATCDSRIPINRGDDPNFTARGADRSVDSAADQLRATHTQIVSARRSGKIDIAPREDRVSHDTVAQLCRRC